MIEGIIFDLDGTLVHLPIEYDNLFRELGRIMKLDTVRPLLQTIPTVSSFLPASESCTSHVWTREPQFEPFFCAWFDVVFALHTSFFCACDGNVFTGLSIHINASKFTQFVQCHCSIYLDLLLRLPAQWARCENPLGLEQLIDFLYLLLHFSNSSTV